MTVGHVYVTARRDVSKVVVSILTLVPKFIADFCQSAKLPLVISLQRMFCNRS